MRLIERRIGLLFAVFLCMLGLAGLRATWLGVVKADTLRKVAATQQTAKVVVPARRGAITDRNGIELAVSQPATTVAVTPYLIKDPQRVAHRIAKPLGVDENTLLRQLTRRDTGFAYLAHQVPAIRARRVQRMKIEGLEFIPEARRTYPRDFLASQLIGSVGAEGSGLSGLEYSLDGQLHGSDGERRLTKDALGQAIELRETRREKPGEDVTLTLDEAIQDKAEQVLAEVGETWRPRGATAIVMDPAQRRAARARQLAAGQRQRARRRTRLRAPEPRGRHHLRARLDVQGVHGRGRAPGARGHAEHEVRPGADDPRSTTA